MNVTTFFLHDNFDKSQFIIIIMNFNNIIIINYVLVIIHYVFICIFFRVFRTVNFEFFIPNSYLFEVALWYKSLHYSTSIINAI